MKTPRRKNPKSRTKRQQVIVFKDGAGNLYEIPRAMLDRRKVNKNRKKKVKAALEDEDCFTTWIKRATIPGSVASAPFVGGRALHYAGFYLRAKK